MLAVTHVELRTAERSTTTEKPGASSPTPRAQGEDACTTLTAQARRAHPGQRGPRVWVSCCFPMHLLWGYSPHTCLLKIVRKGEIG